MTDPLSRETIEPTVKNAQGGLDQGGVRFERKDVDVSPIVWFVVVLAVIVILCMVVLRYAFSFWLAEEKTEKRTAYPVAAEMRSQFLKDSPAKLLPPEPRIEGISVAGIEQKTGRMIPEKSQVDHSLGRLRPNSSVLLYSEQEKRLASWGWQDASHAVAHIPISEAMKRLLDQPQKYLPVRKNP